MCRVLVIDDEEDVRLALRRRLQRAGFTVELADGEREGLAMLQEARPPFDVVVTDMAMEDSQSGVRVLQHALSQDLLAEVIVLTAYGNVSNAVDCMRRGAFDYVEKNMPGIDAYELVVLKVEDAMEQKRNAMRAIRRFEKLARQIRDENDTDSAD